MSEEKIKKNSPDDLALQQAGGKSESAEELTSLEEKSLYETEAISAGEEPPSAVIGLPKAPQTTNHKPETSEMEVHHHTDHAHGKKNWKTYFWEFVMLFLAVFCGFLAEYQLEHKIEKDREKQFITSLVDDLKSDTKSLNLYLAVLQKRIVIMDSLFLLMDNPELARQQGDLIYYYARTGPRAVTFSSNNRTFDQLKNSGGFRLIRSQEASNKIMSYYVQYPHLRQLEDIFAREFEDYKRLASKIFDPAVFRRAEGKNGEIVLSTNNPSLRSYNPDLLKELGLFTIYLNGTRKTIFPTIENLNKTAIELIGFLEEKYELK